MATVNSFEELDVWKAGCGLAVSVLSIADDELMKDELALRHHFKSSALSIPAKISEGFERSSNKHFARFLWMAKGSAGELRTFLHIAAKSGKINSGVATELVSDSRQIAMQLATLIEYLQKHSSDPVKHMPTFIERKPDGTDASSLKKISNKITEDIERETALAALDDVGWDRPDAAKALNISQPALDSIIEKHGMTKGNS